MNTLDLYIVQVKEALNFYNNSHKEYKRLSLILLDNIIEVILKTKASETIYKHYRLKLSESQIDNKIKSCNFFENLTKESSKIGLISSEERQILNFTHEIRNIQFHEPYPTEFSHISCQERLIEFGVLSNIEFLIAKSSTLINLNPSFINCFPCSFETLSQKAGVKQPVELILLLSEVYSRKKKDPNILLSEILSENIEIIEEFFESEANENWDSFREKTLESFLYHLKIDEKKISKSVTKNFPKMDDKKLEKLKFKYGKTTNKTTFKMIESYRTFQFEYGNMMKGIAIYQLLNSYYEEYD